MMASQVKWNVMEELKRELRNLAPDLAAEASDIVQQAAEGAAAFIKAAYPAKTGNLKKGVSVTRLDRGKVAAGAVVVNKAKHAFIYENGTQARHNAIGANRGAMPPGHVFVPRVIRARQQMYQKLAAMVEAHGLKVTGEP